jgi:hypothetical protein
MGSIIPHLDAAIRRGLRDFFVVAPLRDRAREPVPAATPEPAPHAPAPRVYTPIKLAPTRRAALRWLHRDQIIGFTPHAVQRCSEREISALDVATRVSAVSPGPYLGRGKRRFRGADGLVAIAAPWAKGWVIITVRREEPA